jgi:segregation and condensation protein A
MDLLLELVRNQKVDIKDINLLELIDQYLNIVENTNLKTHSEYASMAAWLIAIKCRRLLPNNEEDVSEEELKIKLLKYEEYTKISTKIKEILKEHKIPIYKEESILDKYQLALEIENDGNIDEISEILWLVIEKQISTKQFDQNLIEKEELKIENVKDDIMSEIYLKSRINYIDFIKDKSLNYIIISFLEILSLVATKKIKIVEIREDLIILERVEHE